MLSERPPVAPFGYRVLYAMYVMLPWFLVALIVEICNNFPSPASDYVWASLICPILVVLFAIFKKSVKPMQIHLSTAVILMFTAAILLWLNLRNRSGWPLDARLTERQHWIGGKIVVETGHWVGFDRIYIDVAISYLLIGLVYRLCEWRIRRQNAKAENSDA
jgi:hypothetical protein